MKYVLTVLTFSVAACAISQRPIRTDSAGKYLIPTDTLVVKGDTAIDKYNPYYDDDSYSYEVRFKGGTTTWKLLNLDKTHLQKAVRENRRLRSLEWIKLMRSDRTSTQ